MPVCEFCIKHGEGKKWYEVMQNYSRELLAQDNRELYIANFLSGMLQNGSKSLEKLDWAKRKMPLAHRFIRRLGTNHMKKFHFGQVVPLEDAEMIVDMVQSVTRVPCVCRGVSTGNNNARYCLALGIDPSGYLGDYPHLKESLETLSAEEAKKLLREFDREGLVHSVWTFKTPYIGGICNCDHDCMAYKMQVAADLMKIMFKAEYIAEIDAAQCVGCRQCQKLCQFGGIEYSSLNKKCIINLLKCYGCGVCRNSCKKGAIDLIDRNRLPQVEGVW